MPLPLKTEDVTAKWLSAALSSRYPGVEVTSLQVGNVIRGTATKMQVLLAYNDAGRAHGLPPTMVLKGGFDIPTSATSSG